MDRAQPGARGSTNRNIEFGETTSQYSDGWIVPSDDPTLSAQRYTSLDETAFNEFDAAYTTDSLTVTIDPGEAFVDGWIARDTATDLTLAPATAKQVVVLGWNPDAVYDEAQHSTRDAADEVVVSWESDVPEDTPYFLIWSFDTDDSGVVSATDHRPIGPTIEATNTVYDSQRTGSVDVVSPDAITDVELDFPAVVAEHPDRLPIAELDDGESIEIPVLVAHEETLRVYRWGAYDIGGLSSPTGLDVELLDHDDIVQASENTTDNRNVASPIASYQNTSGSESLFKLRAINNSGARIDSPGVGAHFGYVVN
jgi:hypothetical protein